MTAYLEAADDLLSDDGEAYKQAIIERYPAYAAPFVVDIGNFYLFDTRPRLISTVETITQVPLRDAPRELPDGATR
ncbi:hypothetical protein OG562_04200 [Streptomyces sp. NBC_01275]|uniref:hypothetical protein n=1 Tax=Streptomyces sp. NBC_01275 TaxID=2903807 RepID=UPI00225209C1|nr:hypothetical protein [Streptomyces sp. NBC_01275]MCX4760196.1 hypothetical protein [Streptomyces sp. NBC_01275]